MLWLPKGTTACLSRTVRRHHPSCIHSRISAQTLLQCGLNVLQKRSCRSSITTNGTAMTRFIAEQSTSPLSKYSLDDLLQLEEMSPSARLFHLETVLKAGISQVILLLQGMPLGFGSVDPIRSVILDYVQDLKDLHGCPSSKDPARFQEVVITILDRHKYTNRQVAKGLREFQHQIKDRYASFSNCADISQDVPAISRIEKSLDRFFTVRSTLRLLITHCVQMSPKVGNGERFHVMHDLLRNAPHSLRTGSLQLDEGHIGAVCLDTRPAAILVKAFKHARKMCKAEFGCASELFVNQMPAREFQLFGQGDLDFVGSNFAYVDTHLYYMFFEVLKNSLRASARKDAGKGKPPPIHATLMIGTSLDTENERAIKISDEGEGMRKSDVKKVWSYFYSTGNAQNEPDEVTSGLLSTGRGLGLPMTRVLARYFGGEIDLHSIKRKGTDAYIYL
eukprot:TRINITY_DN4614_c0_g3_i3.p1 TRINITY_DN4614_c0_g3~~TRINITY_DN4614_c0_g3_i3.p1  ORF type:complete len:448 (+),score=52.81 TRINITY_DN4614_c0_g3_i3:37-1380(+)